MGRCRPARRVTPATTYPTLIMRVDGLPAGQGSKVRTRFGMRDDNSDKLKPWRANVTHSAIDAMGDVPRPWFGRGIAVIVEINIALPRPGLHYGTGRNVDVLRAAAPSYCTRLPDVDKAARAILDALTDSGVWLDDRQVVHLTITKDWVGEYGMSAPGATVRVQAAP